MVEWLYQDTIDEFFELLDCWEVFVRGIEEKCGFNTVVVAVAAGVVASAEGGSIFFIAE